MKTKIVIWGADNYNTLGLVRSLADERFDVLLLINGSKQGVASASRYCKHYRTTKSIEEAVKYLEENYPEQEHPLNKAVLIPGGDAYSVASAEYYDSLHKRFHLMCTTDPQVLIDVTDKDEMGKAAKKAGLLIPKAQKYSVGTMDITVPFPVILKPIETEGRVEFKTKVLKSKEELEHFKKFLNPHNTYLMQQFIPRSHDIVVYGCRLPNGETKLAGHHTLERWSDDGGGSYGHLSPEIPNYLQADALKRLLDNIDYHGLFSAEYGFCNGKAYFYEVNLRNDGFCHLSFQAGANLPLLWVSNCLNLGIDASPVMTNAVVGMNEIYDFTNVLRGNISYKRFKQDKKEAEAFHFYDPNDLQPYKNMHSRMFWEIPFRALLKTFRPKIVWFLSKIGR